MNDENTRKFLQVQRSLDPLCLLSLEPPHGRQAFKRLMSFKQSLYPNIDGSKNCG